MSDDGLSEDERRDEMKKRIEEISSSWEVEECPSCKNWHLVVATEPNKGCTSTACCACFCHETGHRLLIYATGDNAFTPPHHVAFKIVDGSMVC